jgi:hypothetical protein
MRRAHMDGVDVGPGVDAPPARIPGRRWGPPARRRRRRGMVRSAAEARTRPLRLRPMARPRTRGVAAPPRGMSSVLYQKYRGFGDGLLPSHLLCLGPGPAPAGVPRPLAGSPRRPPPRSLTPRARRRLGTATFAQWGRRQIPFASLRRSSLAAAHSQTRPAGHLRRVVADSAAASRAPDADITADAGAPPGLNASASEVQAASPAHR